MHLSDHLCRALFEHDVACVCRRCSSCACRPAAITCLMAVAGAPTPPVCLSCRPQRLSATAPCRICMRSLAEALWGLARVCSLPPWFAFAFADRGVVRHCGNGPVRTWECWRHIKFTIKSVTIFFLVPHRFTTARTWSGPSACCRLLVKRGGLGGGCWRVPATSVRQPKRPGSPAAPSSVAAGSSSSEAAKARCAATERMPLQQIRVLYVSMLYMLPRWSGVWPILLSTFPRDIGFRTILQWTEALLAAAYFIFSHGCSRLPGKVRVGTTVYGRGSTAQTA